MKLKPKEQKALELLRQLDARQRDHLLGVMQRQVLANQITARVGGLRKLKIPHDREIEAAFGPAPRWKGKRRAP